MTTEITPADHEHIRAHPAENPYANLTAEVIRVADHPRDIVDQLARERYPDDPEASSLLTKKLLRGATDAETAELAQREPRAGRLDRLEEIGLSEGRTIAVKPGEEAKYLLTSQLNGCTATVHYREYSDGTREASLTHYSPYFRQQQIDTFGALMPAEAKPAREHVVIITEARRGGGAEMARAVRDMVGEHIPIDQYTYDAKDKSQPDWGAVVVDVEPRSSSSCHLAFREGVTL